MLAEIGSETGIEGKGEEKEVVNSELGSRKVLEYFDAHEMCRIPHIILLLLSLVETIG